MKNTDNSNLDLRPKRHACCFANKARLLGYLNSKIMLLKQMINNRTELLNNGTKPFVTVTENGIFIENVIFDNVRDAKNFAREKNYKFDEQNKCLSYHARLGIPLKYKENEKYKVTIRTPFGFVDYTAIKEDGKYLDEKGEPIGVLKLEEITRVEKL